MQSRMLIAWPYLVVDRNRITGGGVTAGLDFGLSLLDILSGSEVAKLTRILLEYDPASPFNAGTPELTGPEVTAIARSIAQENLDRGIASFRTLLAASVAGLELRSDRVHQRPVCAGIRFFPETNSC